MEFLQKFGIVGAAVFGRIDVIGGHPQQFFAGVTETLASDLVDFDEIARLAVGQNFRHKNSVAAAVEQAVETLLAFAQLLGGLLPLPFALFDGGNQCLHGIGHLGDFVRLPLPGVGECGRQGFGGMLGGRILADRAAQIGDPPRLTHQPQTDGEPEHEAVNERDHAHAHGEFRRREQARHRRFDAQADGVVVRLPGPGQFADILAGLDRALAKSQAVDGRLAAGTGHRLAVMHGA